MAEQARYISTLARLKVDIVFVPFKWSQFARQQSTSPFRLKISYEKIFHIGLEPQTAAVYRNMGPVLRDGQTQPFTHFMQFVTTLLL